MTYSVLEIENIEQKFSQIVATHEWGVLERYFASARSVLLVGNGGNLAVADHAAVDISRITDKTAIAPGSGILGSSLSSDVGFDLWLRSWVEIQLRHRSQEQLQQTLILGISSSGTARNVLEALDFGHSAGARASLLSARPRPACAFNTIVLNTRYFHTGEALSLLLTYQLSHSAGFAPPAIGEGNGH